MNIKSIKQQDGVITIMTAKNETITAILVRGSWVISSIQRDGKEISGSYSDKLEAGSMKVIKALDEFMKQQPRKKPAKVSKTDA